MAEPQTTQQPRRRGGSPWDIVLSLAVLLIPVIAIVALTRACTDIAVVDPSGAIGEARAAGAFPVLAPEGLEPAWRPVRAEYRNGTLRVGYLTPADSPVQLLETNEDPQVLLPREFGPDTEPTGQVDVNGTAWRSYRVRGQEQALVLTTGSGTTVLQGRASAAELQTLAAALR